MKNKLQKVLAICLIMILGVTMLAGCGSKSPEEYLKTMKQFSTADGSASIYLNEKWTVEDMGVDFCLAAGNALGNQACALFRSPKKGMNQFVDNMDGMVEFVEASYNYTGAPAEAPEIPNMTNVSASQGSMDYEGSKLEGYAVYGETDYAYYGILFCADKMTKGFLESAKVSCTTIEENQVEEVDNTTVEITDTIRWINATYAVLTDANGWDYNRFGGLPANDEYMASVQQMLVEWWDVTDRSGADETLQWALAEGHRTAFADDMLTLDENGIAEVAPEERKDFLLENFDMDDTMAQFYTDMYAMYEEFGAGAIDGWDYCRALNLCGYYYIAGYYTEQEALDVSLEIAKTVQPLFGSWDELVESYMRGYEYWAEESADERRAIYEDLKTRSDNPYAVDYNVTLEKTW